MGEKCNKIRLYTSQTDVVMQTLQRDGVCYSKEEYVHRKYQESAPIFRMAYSWFVKNAQEIVPRPLEAEYPYWAFTDLYNVDKSGVVNVQVLDVPIDQVIFFDMLDWTKIMKLSYIGENNEEEKAFQQEMKARGINNNEVMLTNFYMEYKKKIMDSWMRLFRHHEKIKGGDTCGVYSVQAGLWQIRKEWLSPSE